MYKSAVQHSLLGCIFHHKSEIPYLPGYSLRRHCIGTAVMLTKQADSWDVKDLRTIFLLDSEENHTYKRIGRKAIRAFIEHRKLLQSNTSDHKASTVSHGINRTLVFDYKRYLLQPFSLACSDIKICYDRIFH